MMPKLNVGSQYHYYNIDLHTVNQEFSVGTKIKHDYIRKILYYHSNLTEKLKFTAAKLS